MAKQSAKESLSQYKNILADLKAKKYLPFYLLMGEEPYYIDQLHRYIAEHVLTPEERDFNQVILYGSDAKVTGQYIVETARRYPMMAPKWVVIVREAQLIKSIERELEIYLQHPPETTLLVVCHPGKTVDKRTTFFKLASTKGAVLDSVPLREEEVADWISRYASEMKIGMTPDASLMLADYLGPDLNKISMEMDKLLVALPTDCRQITPDLIEQNVGISKEHSPFALCKAISFKDMPKALRMVRYFGDNAKIYPLPVVLGALFSHFARLLKYHALCQGPSRPSRGELAQKLGMNPYFLNEIETAAQNFPLHKTAQIIWLLRAYDGRSKSNDRGEATDGDLLQELLFKILR
ncbi:MAG: DNA polymerase III subunit delta [Bacteroidetes bacterium]|nr:DNA polymerase III subunit delta [Bacteroidota bacterium]